MWGHVPEKNNEEGQYTGLNFSFEFSFLDFELPN